MADVVEDVGVAARAGAAIQLNHAIGHEDRGARAVGLEVSGVADVAHPVLEVGQAVVHCVGRNLASVGDRVQIGVKAPDTGLIVRGAKVVDAGDHCY